MVYKVEFINIKCLLKGFRTEFGNAFIFGSVSSQIIPLISFLVSVQKVSVTCETCLQESIQFNMYGEERFQWHRELPCSTRSKYWHICQTLFFPCHICEERQEYEEKETIITHIVIVTAMCCGPTVTDYSGVRGTKRGGAVMALPLLLYSTCPYTVEPDRVGSCETINVINLIRTVSSVLVSSWVRVFHFTYFFSWPIYFNRDVSGAGFRLALCF